MYHDVLVPTDGSDGTRQAIEHGLTIAARFDATVHAFSVVPEGPLGTMNDDNASIAAERAVAHVEGKARERDVSVRTAIERGVPHEAILSYADANDIDMIVMGTQGRTGLDRFLVGSVTERTVRMSDLPVVTVRKTAELEIEDPEEAERLVGDALEETNAQSDAKTVLEEQYRTNGEWVVRIEGGDRTGDAYVDAVTGAVRFDAE